MMKTNVAAIGLISQALKKNDYPTSYLTEVLNSLGLKQGEISELSTKQNSLLQHILYSLSQQIPVEYLVGEAVFYERRFKVTQDVLIPRFDTEKLVVKSLEIASTIDGPLTILDVGTGSGAIIISLAKELAKRKDTGFLALDISPEALAIAKENAIKHAVLHKIDFRLADTFPRNDSGEPYVPNTKHILIVSNPPYISAKHFDALPKSVKDYEPELALRENEVFLPQVQTYVDHLRNAGIAVHCAIEYCDRTGKATFRFATPLQGDLRVLLES